MEAIKVVIVDDEILARNLLKEYLAAYKNFVLIAECKNGNEAIGVINALKPDLVFLDVQMPGINGFAVLNELEVIPKIIFSTAYEEYAIKAFNVNAIDYLLKPYTKQRFADAIQKAATINNPYNIEKLLETVSYKAYTDNVLVQKGYTLINLPVSEIVYIEAQNDYAFVHTAKDAYITQKGIGEIEKKLDPDKFIRVHRSFIVAFNHIAEIQKDTGGYRILTANGKKINVSRSYAGVISALKL
ncbi:LytTR family DNA-binding domain-containing protein [Flavobacterium sp. D11R37]|uniref:LytR/AlgR family response regulator transcription factor n=1 Tax=Flavobacterium coralii TaxID=2838017 RepID=UPI001CA68F02|nr:LytTR family DNA-binding domain-containing protein [Flavobacterium coralii]MBY8963210.1 LytTR family DNA-binding domain-containing protein [Flavobacterium coralii]